MLRCQRFCQLYSTAIKKKSCSLPIMSSVLHHSRLLPKGILRRTSFVPVCSFGGLLLLSCWLSLTGHRRWWLVKLGPKFIGWLVVAVIRGRPSGLFGQGSTANEDSKRSCSSFVKAILSTKSFKIVKFVWPWQNQLLHCIRGDICSKWNRRRLKIMYCLIRRLN